MVKLTSLEGIRMASMCTVTAAITWRLRARIWIARQLLRLTGWVLGAPIETQVEFKPKPENPHD